MARGGEGGGRVEVEEAQSTASKLKSWLCGPLASPPSAVTLIAVRDTHASEEVLAPPPPSFAASSAAESGRARTRTRIDPCGEGNARLWPGLKAAPLSPGLAGLLYGSSGARRAALEAGG